MWTLVQLLGAVMVVGGTAWLSVPAAVIVAGVLVTVFGVLLEPRKGR